MATKMSCGDFDGDDLETLKEKNGEKNTTPLPQCYEK